MRPKLAISVGDPCGIGPEIVAANLRHAVERADVAVFGHWPSLRRSLERLDPGLPVEVVDALTSPPPPAAVVAIHTRSGELPFDHPCTAAAESQIRAVADAVDAVLTGSCDAVVTGPVSKAAIAEVRPGFTGHTEYLAARCGLRPDDVTMVFASRALAVGLIATHIPLRRVPETITVGNYERTLRHVAEVLAALGKGPNPRIAVAALNPHAGEGGCIGSEEVDMLGPFCAASAGERGRRGEARDLPGPDLLDADAGGGGGGPGPGVGCGEDHPQPLLVRSGLRRRGCPRILHGEGRRPVRLLPIEARVGSGAGAGNGQKKGRKEGEASHGVSP